MAFGNGPSIVTNGLILSLDAGDRNSYVSGSTVWNDLTGNNNSGSLTNGPAFNTGSFGNLVFDGINDYAAMSPINASSQFTMNFWLNPISSGSTGAKEYVGIINRYNGGPSTGPNVGFRNRLLLASTFDQFLFQPIVGGVSYSISSSVFSSIQNTISMCTTTYDGSFMRFYVNANSVGSSSLSGTLDSGTGQATLAWGALSQDYYFNGRMYNFQMYNRALSASEVIQNYNATKTRFGL